MVNHASLSALKVREIRRTNEGILYLVAEIQFGLSPSTLAYFSTWEQIYAATLVSIMAMLNSTELRYSEHYTTSEALPK